MKRSEYNEMYYKNLCEKMSYKISLLEKMLKRKTDEANKKAKMDPVGKEDEDIDNDGKPNTETDKYLKNRREKIKQSMMKKKKTLKEGTVIGNENLQYGGFPRILKEEEEEENLSEVGVDEMFKLLSRGAHPKMAGDKPRGVPPEIRKQALAHLETVRSFPQGKIEGYTTNHPIYKKAMEAHKFFKTHFPDFGVEEQIADHNSLFDPDVLNRR
jgi:hypothetical protein